MNSERITKLGSALALLGVAAFIVTDIAGILVVNNYNPIADTISNLAVGSHAWIQDSGLIILGVGLIGLAISFFTALPHRFVWLGTSALLILSGIFTILIAINNQYAGANEGAIHRPLVYTLYALLAVSYLLTALGFKYSKYFKFAATAGILWIIVGPAYLLSPTGYDGLIERILVLILLTWMSYLAVLLPKLDEPKLSV